MKKLKGECHSQKAHFFVFAHRNGGSDVEFWAPLEMTFIRKTGTLEAETSVSG